MYEYSDDRYMDNFKVKLFLSNNDYTKSNETTCVTGSKFNDEMDDIFHELKASKEGFKQMVPSIDRGESVNIQRYDSIKK